MSYNNFMTCLTTMFVLLDLFGYWCRYQVVIWCWTISSLKKFRW